MPFSSDNLVRRDASGCDVLWFSWDPNFDPGSFAAGAPTVLSLGSWVSGGTWLRSGRGNDVISCSWTKTVEGQASGVCVVQLKKGRDWRNLIRPGDALAVFMSSTQGGSVVRGTFVSLVFVDRVENGVGVDEKGATVAVVAVSARDFGKVLEETATVYDPTFAFREQAFYSKAHGENLDKKIGLSPSEMVLSILNNLYNSQNPSYTTRQWRFPSAENVPIASFLDVSTFVQTPTFGFCPAHVPDYAGAGNVWTLLSSYANLAVNELFIDVRDVDDEAVAHMKYQEDLLSSLVFGAPDRGDVDNAVRLKKDVAARFAALGKTTASRLGVVEKPDTIASGSSKRATLSLVLRQRPYDTGSFRKLPASVLDESEIIQSNFGRAYHFVRNFFRFFSNPILPGWLQELQFGILVNPKSIAKFGLRRMDIESQYIYRNSKLRSDADDGSLPLVAYSAAYQYYVDLAATWYAFNDRFVEGPAVCHFRPDIRAGTRLTVTERSGRLTDFYVQAVRHAFFYEPAQSRTFLTLVRGVEAGASAVPQPEANIFWTDQGRWLPVEDPYEQMTNTVLGMQKPENVPPSAPQQSVPFRFIPPGTDFGVG